MRIKNLPALLVLFASPVALFALPETDRKIEDAAKASYNYRTVLENHVAVKANDGVVTLTGIVGDRDLKVLAEDTVGNLPGVARVDNQITLDPALAEHSDGWIAIKLTPSCSCGALSALTIPRSGLKAASSLSPARPTGQSQKELTGEYAKEIEWVKSVKNDIVVNATPVPAESMGGENDDASISSQVKYVLYPPRDQRAQGRGHHH